MTKRDSNVRLNPGIVIFCIIMSVAHAVSLLTPSVGMPGNSASMTRELETEKNTDATN